MKTDRSQAWSPRGPLLLGVLTLALVIGGGGGWAAFGRIGGAIVLPAQLVISRDRHVIRHHEGGTVAHLAVSEGQEVRAGDLLFSLDAKAERAEAEALATRRIEIDATILRLEAERDGLVELAAPDDAAPGLQDALARERDLFDARRDSLRSAATQLETRIRQLQRRRDGLDAQRIGLERQKVLAVEDLATRTTLLDRGLAVSDRVRDLEREIARLDGHLGEILASHAEAAEQIAELRDQALGLSLRRREEVLTQFGELSTERSAVLARSAALQAMLDGRSVKAPVQGIVQELAIPGAGATIGRGEVLLVVVPRRAALVARATVGARNVDQVHPGQAVRIRPFVAHMRDAPTIGGTVLRLSPDATRSEAGAPVTYRVEIGLDALPNAAERLLRPGLPVEAFLRTEDRSPLDYLVGPLLHHAGRAFHDG